MAFKPIAITALLLLSACADKKDAPDDALAKARYVAPAPRSITLFTVISTRNGSGAHSGLLVNGSQQVIFDPAGTWYHPTLPERGDVHYGVTPRMEQFYIDYHARITYNVIEQTVVVPPDVAEMVLARVETHGAVGDAQCAHAVSDVLAGVPGFETVRPTWFPKQLSKEFGEVAGATYQKITETDSADHQGVLLAQVASPAN